MHDNGVSGVPRERVTLTRTKELAKERVHLRRHAER